MSFFEHLTEFGGLPVVDYPCADLQEEQLNRARQWARRTGHPLPERLEPSEAYTAALAAPGTAAWRLRVMYPARQPFADLFAHFLDEVDTAQVSALVVGCWGEETGQGPRDLLVEHADRFPALRALFFGEFVQEEAEVSWIEQCDVAPLLAAFPRLEELRVRGGSGLEFPATRHEALRTLVVETGGLPRRVPAGVLASDLPALEHLELWFGVEDYGGTTTVDDLAPLLAGERFPALRRLGLRNSEWGDDLVRRLADAPVTQRVKVLDLSGHVLTDAGGEVLAAAPAFRGLERLVIHHHFLTEEMEERLRAALTGVDVDLDGRREPEVYKDEVFYYPQVTE